MSLQYEWIKAAEKKAPMSYCHFPGDPFTLSRKLHMSDGTLSKVAFVC